MEIVAESMDKRGLTRRKMEVLDRICSLILMITGFFTIHKTIYCVIGFFIKAKVYEKTEKRNRYAVVIAARNEEAVIGNLIDSIQCQSYPREYVDIIVVADNCTDHTAKISKEKGAIVYERCNPEQARKGYALQFLFEQIKRDIGIENYDGYFVFDADNLLAPNFIEEMNKAFASGEKIVTSYRNTKNFDTNIISSAYGIHFCHNSMTMHRPRAALHIGTHLTGTGYLIASDLLKDGWNYTIFTEDDQITMCFTAKGYKVAYCEAAEFFDEQPCDFKTVWKQRVRWAKGRLLNFMKYGYLTLLGIVKNRSFTCYDMFTHYFPYGLFNFIISMVYPLVSLCYATLFTQEYDYRGMVFNIILLLGSMYFSALVKGALTVIREHKHIRCNKWRLVLYTFTYPWFSMISIPVYVVAIFKKVRWEPIVHSDNKKICDLL